MEERKPWQDVIDQGLRIRGIGLITRGSAPRADTKRLPHDEAIRSLRLKGYHPIEIRDAMMMAGYFAKKNKNQVLGFINNILRQDRRKPQAKKPPQPAVQSTLKEDRMMALTEKLKGRLMP